MPGFDSDVNACGSPPMNRTDWGLLKTYAGNQVQRPGSHRPRPAQMVSSNSDTGPPKSPASKRWLGVDGVTLDKSRIWKPYGGMWQ